MELFFVLCVLFVVYPYAGYPLLLALLARRGPSEAGSGGEGLPKLTILIAAHDEEARIGGKITDLLTQDYPAGRLEIIVVSDASADRTDEIVSRFAGRGVRLLRSPERVGKIAAQNLAIPEATGDLVVFTDAASRFDPGTLAALVRPFSDPEIGCVSSVDRIDGGGGEALYVRYEMMLRRLETRFHSVAGVSGSGYAVRRSLVGIWPGGFPNDFITPLKVVEGGHRAVSEEAAVARYGETGRHGDEFRRKVRTVIRGIATLWAMRGLLDPLGNPRIAFVLLSHKILRWTVPFALLGALAANAALAPSGAVWAALLACQIAFYLLGLLGILAAPLRRLFAVKIASFLIVVNASIAVAWFRYAMGERAVVWEPTRREAAP